MNSDVISKMAKRDAERYARATLNYGKGAGNARKAIRMEVQGKKNKYPGYSALFDEALLEVNDDEQFKKIQNRKKAEAAYTTAKKGVRLARRAANFYGRNKGIITDILEGLFR